MDFPHQPLQISALYPVINYGICHAALFYAPDPASCRPVMSPAQQGAFQAGSGVAPGTLLTAIASMTLVLAFVWVVWVTMGTFRAWQAGQATDF